jgi:YteA family regulatory protein
MDPDKLEQLRARLLRERAVVRREISAIQQTMDVALEDSIGELSTYDNHPADIAGEAFERSKDFALRENARFRLLAVEDALAKIDRGTYGRCDECGAKISLERLEAVPFTTKCRDCKAHAEVRDERARPVEEEVFTRPWAPPGQESTIYDREDAWQDASQDSLSTETENSEEEDRGHTEDVDAIPYVKEDGVFFQNTRVRGDTGEFGR